jgi:hypothetical protein
MGAPGIEAETPVTTVFHYGPLKIIQTACLRGVITTTYYSAQPQPPTYEPPTNHPYKCPGGQL